MFNIIFTAFQSLAANKMRTALTMLGTIIGVACVVALWNIGESGRTYMRNSLRSVGANIMFVMPRYGSDEEEQRRYRFRPLGLKDAFAIRENCPSVDEVSPIIMTSKRAVYGSRFRQARIWGTFPSYLPMREWTLEKGVAFSDTDLRGRNCVALLGTKVAQELFGSMDPLGEKIRIGKVPFKVIGVLKSKGSMFGDNQDNRIIAPFTAVADHLGLGRQVQQIFVTAKSRSLVPQAQKEIRLAVRASQNIPHDRKDPVEIHDMGQMAKVVDYVLMGITALLGAIGAISLVVGGIGIMNIMLVSVSERTKEIGLRMAVGAGDFQILMQFLIESSVLSTIGGLIGVVLGILTAAGAGKIMGLFLKTDFPFELNIISVVVAVVFSAGVGIFFGFYPAWRASRLDPIVALRRE